MRRGQIEVLEARLCGYEQRAACRQQLGGYNNSGAGSSSSPQVSDGGDGHPVPVAATRDHGTSL
jgi:hypothetical protein